SISSNIAEGFSRQSKKEKMQFYYTSKGSLTELENQLIIAKDVGYILEINYQNIHHLIEKTGRLLTGLTRSAMKRT
ncbi:four helix bundle protein, partial [bacterium]|nr:four helix bundle protein [bacterium]